jgi:hypothetical protein
MLYYLRDLLSSYLNNLTHEGPGIGAGIYYACVILFVADLTQ